MWRLVMDSEIGFESAWTEAYLLDPNKNSKKTAKPISTKNHPQSISHSTQIINHISKIILPKKNFSGMRTSINIILYVKRDLKFWYTNNNILGDMRVPEKFFFGKIIFHA